MPTNELILIGLIVFGLFTLYAYIYALTICLIAAIVPVKVERISLGFGETLANFSILGRKIKIGLLPLGTSIKFVEGPQGLEGLSRPFRLLFRVVGEVIVLAAAIAYLPELVLGLPEKVASTAWGLIVEPFNTARSVAGQIVQVVRTEDPAALIALACGLQAIINLVPLPSVNGGAFLVELFEWMTGSTLNYLKSGPLLVVSLLAILYCYGWMIAGFFLI